MQPWEKFHSYSRLHALDVLAEDGVLLLKVGGLFSQLAQLVFAHLKACRQDE
jgi:hypothetical protein